MASQEYQLHFVLFPFMAQGHMIPMVDIARMLAQHGVTITIVTTPLNAARFETVLARAKESGYQIRLMQLKFPFEGAGLPHGCENLDMVPSFNLASNFFNATKGLQEPVEKLFEELTPKPSCIISDMCLPWTINISRMFNIPRISFSGTCCFTLLCFSNARLSKVHDEITSETEYFVLPDLPDRIEVTKAQLPGTMAPDLEEFYEQMLSAEMASYGIIMNSFEELEPAYVQEYKKVKKDKVWCVGPASLCNKDDLDKAQRGNKASVDEHYCLKWLDSWEPSSVLYACFGSLCNLIPAQLIELALGLEESNKPFIWAVRGSSQLKELEKWITENGFEERTKERSLLIRGWAPQTLILSHPAVGGFLTHCGWNSTLEGICAGVPLITWPLFGDQFLDEKLVDQILKIAVRVGVEYPMKWGEEESIGVLVKKENVKEAIDKLMDGEVSEARRDRARELAKLAKRAVQEGGSSHLNIQQLIQDIMQQGNCTETN
ncbi:PREDICTED: UDP-glycosyltransferase 73C1-like [Fragaria vesca subsp. vesca]|uniref:UDP-glycosyltransferase 73C1-like n=1 Tax=Fragaria vesca subsp. vesca TaxID=101020 RepID=UPI0002C2E35B|nr:PREDICTED: UDP-glycosyltransferase 73C1-like [Fragaria vesca subsp. vesca]